MDSLNAFLNWDRFIILGGHKCGTSSMHFYLGQHPEIAMPETKGKDILNQPQLNIEDYKNLYNNYQNQKVFGEVSSAYLYNERGFNNIKQFFPKAKLIVILRNPAERAFSHFNMIKNLKKIDINFEDICKNPDNFIKGENLGIINNGLYYSYLKKYFDEFSREQIMVVLFDTFIQERAKFFTSLFKFVGVKEDFLPDTSVIIRQGGKKNQTINQLISSKNPLIKGLKTVLKPLTTSQQRYMLQKKVEGLFKTKETLSKNSTNKLTSFYQDDILKVQELTNIDLSHWLKNI